MTTEIAGKSIFGSVLSTKAIHLVNLVNALANASLLDLAQRKGGSRTNGITAISGLLDALDVVGCIVAMGAVGCQIAISAQGLVS
jgi:hypothetical protein